MINLSFNVDDFEMRPDQSATAEVKGPLDAEDVYFQYLCTTEGGDHDPEGDPDDRVRDSHAALHGTVWRIDDPFAPVPPIGFGCRCAMRYVGKAGSDAAVVLGEVAPSEPTSLSVAFGKWLGKKLMNAGKYEELAKVTKSADQLGAVYLKLQDDGVSGDLRDIARMVVSAIGGHGRG